MISGCADESAGPKLFERLDPEETGVTFANELPEDPAFNILNYLNYYNGGGVAVGDVNGDGLQDLYFTANLGPNKLYLNRGDFAFDDVTEAAGVAGRGNWTTGVTMADVNADGLVDIYVSVVSGYLDREGSNQLYINNGDGTFTDRASEYGLDFAGMSTHAAFFDYDRDSDLDVYLLNHAVHQFNTYGPAEALRYERHPLAGDRLLRNDDGHFVDVSEEAGIYGGVIGYGLSVTVSDLNVDGCPDIYVGNDFHENDYLYYNNCDGTFRESIREATAHNSQSSMGSDAADINQDGLPDLVVLDMLPEQEEILKTSENADPYAVYDVKLRSGYYHQLSRNVLQLNLGNGKFSDIAWLSGVAATDWSWAPLFADFDNDSHVDLFVTNGIYHRPNDLDFAREISRPEVQASLANGVKAEHLALLDHMPSVPISNYAFRNNGDLTFSNMAESWGLDDPGFSNGAAYADLDNDGDLDLVVNNINAPASIYKNLAKEQGLGRHLIVALQGDDGNTAGIGAKVILKHDGQYLLREQMPTRGFQSSVDPRLHFGLGTASRVDSLTVIWNDGRFQTLTDIPVDTMLTLRQEEASGTYDYAARRTASPLFVDATDELAIDYTHHERVYLDWNRESLMPHKLSTEGPALAVGDVNGDGLDDFYVGGAKWQPGRMFVQNGTGFSPFNDLLWQADSLYEDTDAAFFDADGDTDLDLYVVSGGNEFRGESEALQDRLYLNDGRGSFTRSRDALPAFFHQGSVVAPADYDRDGDIDLFVGSRVVEYHYGATPTSYLLENGGRGRFTIATELAEGLAEAGMVSDAAWLDYNGDGLLDLAVAGEWIPVRLFEQQQGHFVEKTEQAGLEGTNGWWNALLAADVDGDGDEDLVGGNLGLNAPIKATAEHPAELYLKDFDENGQLDQILTQYNGDVKYPIASIDDLMERFVFLQSEYTTYHSFGAKQIEDIFTEGQLENAEVRQAFTFASTFFENRGDGTFAVRPLPNLAQVAPVYAIHAADVDGDDVLDLLLAGNFYGVRPAIGRYDAGYGTLLRGDGKGGFAVVDQAASGLYLRGEVRSLEPLQLADGTRIILAARSDDTLLALRTRIRGGGLIASGR